MTVKLFFILFGVNIIITWWILAFDVGALPILARNNFLDQDISIGKKQYISLQLFILGLNILLFSAIIIASPNTFTFLGFYSVLIFVGLFVFFMISTFSLQLNRFTNIIGPILILVAIITGIYDFTLLHNISNLIPNIAIGLGIPITINSLLDYTFGEDKQINS